MSQSPLNENFYASDPYKAPEISMTPFVDVCLVLLIIFMVSAP
jgi:biopolymer transport protein ExbD